jgi:uncharacterized membrane protein
MINELKLNHPAKRLLPRQTGLENHLLLLSLFSLCLLAVRLLYSDQFLYAFMPWNLFLASVPYFISSRFVTQPWVAGRRLMFLICFLIWLIFIPNSFYIITDLFHLRERKGMPVWFDLAMLLSFAWAGLLLGILSVRQMMELIEIFYGKNRSRLLEYAIMALVAFGIYIGRFLRYNTWDVFTNPFSLAADILYLLVHPLRSRNAWAMIGCYSLLIALINISFKKLSAYLNK